MIKAGFSDEDIHGVFKLAKDYSQSITFYQTNYQRHEMNLARRLAIGDTCFLAEDDNGSIAGFCWVVFRHNARKMPWIAGSLATSLQPREAFVYDAYVVPDYRRNRIYERLLLEVLRFLRKEHYLRVYFQVQSGNIPSRKGIVRMGFRARNIVTRVTVLGHKMSFENASTF
jgi:ribosomal protein S18 acetylase RimI-like enzyme